MFDTDVLVIGSGPCGAMLADRLVAAGRTVRMLDYGHDDAARRGLVPDRSFSDLRREDPAQARYFLGEALEGVPRGDVKVGAQLTPARQFVHERADEFLPTEAGGFQPMQSLAVGGLGAAWGTACFTFSPEELARIGLAPGGFGRHYEEVAREIGVSAGPFAEGEPHPWWTDLPGQLPGLDIDSTGETILRRYRRKAAALRERGLLLGPMALAVLSRDFKGRGANPYHDMDFYSESRRSAYRPRYTIEALRAAPNFSYEGGVLALSFREEAGGVAVTAQRGAETVVFRAKRLALCAGGVNSARLALRSLPELGNTTTFLCNPLVFLPSLNWSLFGRETRDRRHSLAQLAGQLEGDGGEGCSLQIYSYRSLLLFKLVKEMPLPAWAGLQVARGLADALALVGMWFADGHSPSKTMTLGTAQGDATPPLRVTYEATPREAAERAGLERKLRRLLPALRCFPLGRIMPGPAGSIHYAGTIPFSNPVNPRFVTAPDFRLAHLSNVFVGDNSSWNWLPAKGPTLTAMASARRIAESIDASL